MKLVIDKEYHSIIDTQQHVDANPVTEDRREEYIVAIKRKQQGLKYDTSFFSDWENDRQRKINPHLFE